MAKIHHTDKKIRQKLEANHTCKQTANNCKWFVWYVAKLSSPAQCAHRSYRVFTMDSRKDFVRHYHWRGLCTPHVYKHCNQVTCQYSSGARRVLHDVQWVAFSPCFSCLLACLLAKLTGRPVWPAEDYREADVRTSRWDVQHEFSKTPWIFYTIARYGVQFKALQKHTYLAQG